MSPLLIALILLNLALFGALGWFALGTRNRRMRQRVERIKRGHPEDAQRQSLSLKREEEGAEWMISLRKRFRILEALQSRLRVGGIEMTVERYLAICAAVMALVFLLVLFGLGKSPILALCLAIILGLGVPHLVVGIRTKRRKKKFLTLFPDAIELIVRGLRAGLPVGKSMQSVAQEIGAPVKDVFQRVVEQMALGVTMERALFDTAEQLGLREFNFFTTSIALQRETGGNLAEILSNLADVLRSRHIMQLKIKAMSSEARASAKIVGALPFMVTGALYIFSPDYLRPLVDDIRGNIAVAIAGFMLFFGMFVMSQMSKFEI